jgi:hypothetical protein
MEKKLIRTQPNRPVKDPAVTGGGRRGIIPRLIEIGTSVINLSRLHYYRLAIPRISEGFEEPQPGVFKKPHSSHAREFALPRRRGLRWHLPYARRTLRHRIDVGETYNKLSVEGK